MLTARQVADRLGLTPRTVLAWRSDGKIPGFKLNGTGPVRFDEAEIDEWLRQQRGAAPREVSAAQNGRARGAAYAPVHSLASAVRPLRAAQPEEVPDAS